MKQKIFKFLKSYSDQPSDVDRLFVSAFIKINNLEIKHNRLLKSYMISSKNKEEYDILECFVSLLKKELARFHIEDLIELFEFVISPSDRIITGAVYTPLHIRKYITDNAFSSVKTNLNAIKIADIACGCGGFLLTAAKKLKQKTDLSYADIFKNNIYGLDIQPYSTDRAKILLSILALTEGEDVKENDFNLLTHDALTFDWEEHSSCFNTFDMVLGNPPYVCARNMSKETLAILQNFDVCSAGNTDLYIPFFQLGIDNLKDNGVLGFITMNSFFKSLNGRKLRDFFKQKSYVFKIVDFGSEQVFKSKNTYTCICLIEKRKSNCIKYVRSSSKVFPNKDKAFSKIPYSEVDTKNGWNLNNYENIRKIESTGVRFGDSFKTRHGIATLKNDIYIFKPIGEDKDYYYLQNGRVFPIEKGICRDIINSNLLSREVSINAIKEKVIFPYDNNTKPKILEERFLKETYPLTYNYLQYKKGVLEQRDKGKGKYENWFAFGRTQSLEKFKTKLFFPKMSDKIPNYLIAEDEDLLFYNGQAIVGHNIEELTVIKKLLESRIFWYYIKTTSKPYSSKYYSLNGIYIKNFGICPLSDNERRFVIQENNRTILDSFFEEKFDLKL